MPTPEPSEARKEVQRAIGRNLLNFQRVEFLLKYLLGISAATGEDLVDAVQKRQTKVSSQMLGLLARQLFDEFLFSRSALPPDTSPHGAKHSLVGKEIAFASTITLGDEHHAEWKARLEKLVNDRNWLVHHFLEDFLPDVLDTEDGCRKARAVLDQQNECIRREVEALKWLIENLHDLHATLHEGLKDLQFRREFFGPAADQGST